MNNSNKTALITGSSDRIGKEMAIFLASINYNVVIHYNKSKEKAQILADEISDKYNVITKIFGCDFNQEKSAQDLANFMLENFTNWNLLINNSSIFKKSKFLKNFDEFDNALKIHLTAPAKLSHIFCEHIIKNKILNAQIINMLDKNIARIDTVNFYYLLTKKFLGEFTKMLALEVAPHIRVNGIAPGYMMPDIGSSAIDVEKIANSIPLKRIGSTKNIIQTLQFLLNNDFVNGQILSIDGGASLNHAG